MLQRFQGDRAVLLGAVGIFSLSLVGGGYLLGDGLRRAKMAERSVTVRGVSERNVTADLATWTISFSEEGPELSGASVGPIKSASQGYFSIGPRDGSGEDGEDGSGSPFQKVRVVTTVDYDIDAG